MFDTLSAALTADQLLQVAEEQKARSLGEQINAAINGLEQAYVAPEPAQVPEMSKGQNFGLALADALQMYGRGLNPAITPGFHTERALQRRESEKARVEDRAEREATRKTAVRTTKAGAQISELQQQRAELLTNKNTREQRRFIAEQERKRAALSKEMHDDEMRVREAQIGATRNAAQAAKEAELWADKKNLLGAGVANISRALRDGTMEPEEAQQAIEDIYIELGLMGDQLAYAQKFVQYHLGDRINPQPAQASGGGIRSPWSRDPQTGELVGGKFLGDVIGFFDEFGKNYRAGMSPTMGRYGPITPEEIAAQRQEARGALGEPPAAHQRAPQRAPQRADRKSVV